MGPKELRGPYPYGQYPPCQKQCMKVCSALFHAKCGKKILHSFFSYQKGLLWHLRVLHSCIRFSLWMITFSIRGPTSTSMTITTKLI